MHLCAIMPKMTLAVQAPYVYENLRQQNIVHLCHSKLISMNQRSDPQQHCYTNSCLMLKFKNKTSPATQDHLYVHLRHPFWDKSMYYKLKLNSHLNIPLIVIMCTIELEQLAINHFIKKLSRCLYRERPIVGQPKVEADMRLLVGSTFTMHYMPAVLLKC